MSTVSFSSSATLSCSEHDRHEESSSSDGGDFAAYEDLSSKSSQGSIDMNCESESTMSDNDEYAVDKTAASFTDPAGRAENQAQRKIHHQPQQHANLVWEDPTIISDISWTDEKHNLYLNSIEEDFIKRLYEQGRYIYSCKRQEAEWITTYVLSKGLHESAEPGIPCDYQPLNLFPQEKEIHNCRKRSRLERICTIKQNQQEGDYINERVNNCKSFKELTGEGSAETGDVLNEDTRKIQIQCFKDNYKHDHGTNKDMSDCYMQEDNVVPSVENTSQNF